MTDTIKKAVELADGWELTGEIVYPPWTHASVAMHCSNPSTIIMDALAAQLVRQVDALEHCEILTSPRQSYVIRHAKIESNAEGPDRTENTVNCIVDSRVLEVEG